MPGLIDSPDGLQYGDGLIFQPAIGGAGLVNPEVGGFVDGALLSGSGAFVIRSIQRSAARVTMGGAGSLSAQGVKV